MSQLINLAVFMLSAALAVGVMDLVAGSVQSDTRLWREPRPVHILARRSSDTHKNDKQTGHQDDKHHDDKHKHSSMMHNHLSRKVFDRACAASKDTIDEIVACISGNEAMLKVIKPEVAGKCYKDSFGQEFDPKDLTLHKELICTNRDKFEDMTACVYRKAAEAMDPKQLDAMTSAMVDVGLCIINALDG